MQNKNHIYNSVVVVVVIALWQESNMYLKQTIRESLTIVKKFFLERIDDFIISIMVAFFLTLFGVEAFIILYLNGWL